MRIVHAVLLVVGALPSSASAAAQEKPKAPEPFAFADFSWVPGNWGPSDHPLSYGPFTGEVRIDAAYHYSFANPTDDTISGSSEVFRHGELQLTQIGFGGDIFYKNVIARLMTQFGMYSQATPRNDASTGWGQWTLDGAYRYISEAYGGYHFDKWSGINLEAGIFMSYIGLWSYYNFDNWTYQPSYVSSNTPWFFEGVRVQIYTSDKLKIEPWLINGWQSYGRFTNAPGIGGQILWRPTGNWSIVANQYFGKDTLNTPDRKRFHSDDSVSDKYHDNPSGKMSQAAASLTIDGATAFSGTPYFTYNPGDPFKAWDMQVAGDYSPVRYITFRLEYDHRHANVPYFAGHGGVTPPRGEPGGARLASTGLDARPRERRESAHAGADGQAVGRV